MTYYAVDLSAWESARAEWITAERHRLRLELARDLGRGWCRPRSGDGCASATRATSDGAGAPALVAARMTREPTLLDDVFELIEVRGHDLGAYGVPELRVERALAGTAPGAEDGGAGAAAAFSGLPAEGSEPVVVFSDVKSARKR